MIYIDSFHIFSYIYSFFIFYFFYTLDQFIFHIYATIPSYVFPLGHKRSIIPVWHLFGWFIPHNVELEKRTSFEEKKDSFSTEQ